MSSYTADSYRAAAHIARRTDLDYEPLAAVAAQWEAEADRMDKLADYGWKLIERVNREGPRVEYSPRSTGMAFMSALLEDGWTPPEGLF